LYSRLITFRHQLVTRSHTKGIFASNKNKHFAMIVNLGGLGLLGTIGCATAQVDGKSRCLAFVRAAAQLGSAPTGADGGNAPSSCATGEVTFVAVRAPSAQRNMSAAALMMQEGGGGGGGGESAFQLMNQLSSLSTPLSGIINSGGSAQQEPAAAMVQRAIERSVIQEQLPLARFELVVQILSSTDDETDLCCVAAAACGALVDSGIPMRDIFGAGSVPISAGGGSSGYVRAVVAAHSGGVLGMQSCAASCPPAVLCQAMESCVKQAADQTLAAFRVAAARKLEQERQKQLQQQQQAQN
jgi:hypothetical protein